MFGEVIYWFVSTTREIGSCPRCNIDEAVSIMFLMEAEG